MSIIESTAVELSAVVRLEAVRRPESVAEVAAAFLLGFASAGTREGYARDLNAWSAWLDRIGVETTQAHRAHVEAWCRSQELDGFAPSTIARRLAAVSGLYAYLEDEQMAARNPVARVRRPRVSEDSPRLGLDREQVRALLTVAEESGLRDHALACLLALNGTRISETLAADIGELSEERGHRVLRLTRKGGKRQTLALAPRTAQALDVLIGDRVSGPIFTTRSGRRLDRQAAARTVRSLARRAGIGHKVSPHSLRHGFVTTALDAGVSLRDVQDAAGHADPRTTRRYDRGRHSLDRHATYAVAAHVAG